MVHDIDYVAKSVFFKVDQFTAFCKDKGHQHGVFELNGNLCVYNGNVDTLVAEAGKAGVERMSDQEIRDAYSAYNNSPAP